MMEEKTWLDRAVERFDDSQFSYGDMLSHLWIKYALEVPEARTLEDAERLQWLLLSRMDKFKTHMLHERQMYLQNVRGSGYRIVKPHEHARIAAEEVVYYIQKGLSKGGEIIDHTRVDALENDEKRVHTDVSIKIAGIRHMMNRQRKDIFSMIAYGGGDNERLNADK